METMYYMHIMCKVRLAWNTGQYRGYFCTHCLRMFILSDAMVIQCGGNGDFIFIFELEMLVSECRIFVLNIAYAHHGVFMSRLSKALDAQMLPLSGLSSNVYIEWNVKNAERVNVWLVLQTFIYRYKQIKDSYRGFVADSLFMYVLTLYCDAYI